MIHHGLKTVREGSLPLAAHLNPGMNPSVQGGSFRPEPSVWVQAAGSLPVQGPHR
jgi:hypothetical protein